MKNIAQLVLLRIKTNDLKHFTPIIIAPKIVTRVLKEVYTWHTTTYLNERRPGADPIAIKHVPRKQINTRVPKTRASKTGQHTDKTRVLETKTKHMHTARFKPELQPANFSKIQHLRTVTYTKKSRQLSAIGLDGGASLTLLNNATELAVIGPFSEVTDTVLLERLRGGPEGAEAALGAQPPHMWPPGHQAERRPQDISSRVCSVLSLEERGSSERAPLRRQLSVDEERGCGGHWAPAIAALGAEATPGAADGLRLYRVHLLRGLRDDRIRPPPCALMPLSGKTVIRETGGWWRAWVEARALSRAARQFASSPQRAALRVRAASVQIAALDYPAFQHILQTLFQEGGASRERVLALFYFLSDLSVLALRGGARAHFCRLTHWAARHITDCATPWVARHGGWGQVIGAESTLVGPEAALVAAACTFAVICLYRLLHRPRPTIL
ncbi:uncharacterized protein LOC143914101 [Arctopsyche grandis]|uniref:uncharacterized protein LOC143914101 n=1 Tax=Arctopsyche grandis TaxID=121162 RepID=UPI00406D99EA